MNESDVFNLIKSRRTCYKFLNAEQFPVQSKDVIKAVEAATFAPNHKMTQPWRFFVLGPDMTQKLSEIYADNRAQKKSKGDPSLYACLYEKAIHKFCTIPTIVMVAQVRQEDPITEKEDYAACSCAIQNFKLMAWQLKMGVQWSSGPIINDIRTYDLLSIDPDLFTLIGALYIGNIDDSCVPKTDKKLLDLDEVCAFLE